MRDLAPLLILAALVWAAWLRPWVGVLALAVVGYMTPQAYGSTFISEFPFFKILFIVVFLSAARHFTLHRKWPTLPHDWRIPVALLFWGYCLLTTYYALVPWAAWPKFLEFSKTVATMGLTLVLIDSRDKLFYLIATIAAAFALIALKGGYWAIMTGFGDRVYGPPGGHFHGNNEFAIAAIMTLPLLFLWLRQTANRSLRFALMILIGFSFIAALSSWSRGALLSLATTTALLVWHSRQKLIAIPLLALGFFLAFSNLPERWFERMGTIVAAERDTSALNRMELWQRGIASLANHPMTGTGFEGWRILNLDIGGQLDWHNAYVEILTEQGIPAFALWAALLLGTLASLTRMAWSSRHSPRDNWVGEYSLMLRAALVAYMVGAFFLGIGYWDVLIQLLAVSIVLKHLAQKGREAVSGNLTNTPAATR